MLQIDQQEKAVVNEQEKVKHIYLWNCGILHSYKGLDPYLDRKKKQVFLAEYVVSLNDRLDQQNCKVFMTSLRLAKQENQELKLAVQELRDHNQVLTLETQQLGNEKELLTQELYHGKMKVREMEEGFRLFKQGQRARMEALEQEKARVVGEYEVLKTKYQELLEKRFQVSQALLTQLNEERLEDIETQLFSGVQRINQERGRRQFLAQLQPGCQDQSVLLQVSQSKLLEDRGEKSTFLVVEDGFTPNDEEDFMSRNFQRRLDFNNVDDLMDSIIIHSQAATTRKPKKQQDEEAVVSSLSH